MTRFMYDAVTPQNIPAGVSMVAGYADGLYANMGTLAARFPHAVRVSIAVRWTTRAQVLDVETGDATPAQAVQWCTQTMSDKPNRELTVYCNMDAWPSVRAAFRAAGVTEPNYWVARYDNDPTIPAGAIAKQYQGDTHGYDKSVVADYWPGVDSAPAPGPAAKPQWLLLLEHVLAVPEGVYEHWVPGGTGWDNHTIWGVEYGEDGVPYCVIGAWDQFHECGLESAVPKTDNVNDFANWARTHGEWTEWPSVGAWRDVGDGAHCEIVLAFTADKVITKGWNSVQTGAQDSGQGNGVWVHVMDRTDPRITGYLAPRFPDNICPPTASSHDPRGGAAQSEYIPEELMALTATDAQTVWSYSHGDTPDVHQTLATAAAQATAAATQATAAAAGVKGLATKVDSLASLALTDTQVTALAAQLATSSGLVDAIAEKVAENLAARLAQ